MGANRRFYALENISSVFKFTINTSLVVSGATDGSENPLTFKIPANSPTINCILRVSDGRPDVAINASNVNTASKITFATAGIYIIEMIGKVGYFAGFNSSGGYDKRKLISVDLWGDVNFDQQAFNGCVNCEFLATNTLVLPSNATAFFANTRGFPSLNLSNIVISNTTILTNICSGIPSLLTKYFNPFLNSTTSLNGYLTGVDFSNFEKIEVYSNTVTTAISISGTSTLRNFNGQIILHTPNNTNIGGLCYRMVTMPSLAQVDVRNVTSALNFLRVAMAKDRVDETLLGWVNNFDWSGIAPVTNKVTLDFKGSSHTNSAAVNDAKAFLQAKGYVFTNLTAV